MDFAGGIVTTSMNGTAGSCRRPSFLVPPKKGSKERGLGEAAK